MNTLPAASLLSRLDALVEEQCVVGFDTEGIGYMTCCGFATWHPQPPHWRVTVVDTLGLKGQPHAGAVWAALKRVLESPRVTKVCWAADHERNFLQLRHGIILRAYEDAMMAYHERWPELPKSLKHAASILTRLPCWTEGISWSEDDDRPAVTGERLWFYNSTDCVATLMIWRHAQLAHVTGVTA